ncbi:hypothetical protein FWF93_01210 [Candidatus Saccharibacteria bacterium]|nr:hypothetical protein [Candidatus Saccharibacteria bacterium]
MTRPQQDTTTAKPSLSRLLAWVLTALAIILLLAFVFKSCSSDKGLVGADEATNLDAQTGVPVIDLDVVQAHSLDGLEPTWEWMARSLPSNNAERRQLTGFTDGLTYPFISKDNAGMRQELYIEILRNPIAFDDYVQGLIDEANTNPGCAAILQHNTWIVEAKQAVDAMMADSAVGWSTWMEYRIDVAGEYVSTPRGVDSFVAVVDGKDRVVFVTEQYRIYATALVYLLDAMDTEGVSSRTAVNWHLPEQGMYATARAAKNPNLESLPALWLRTVPKDGSAGVLIGFNLLDKRIEFPRETAPEVAPPAVANPPAWNQPPTPNPPGPTPTTPSTPNKNPTKVPRPSKQEDQGKQKSDPVGPTTPSNPPPQNTTPQPNPAPKPETPPANNSNNHSNGGGTKPGGDGGNSGGTGSSSSNGNQTVTDGEIVGDF